MNYNFEYTLGIQSLRSNSLAQKVVIRVEIHAYFLKENKESCLTFTYTGFDMKLISTVASFGDGAPHLTLTLERLLF